jgi:hypothetical protein
MLRRCAAFSSFAKQCKRSAANLCLFAFVDTPGHRFVSACRVSGLDNDSSGP